MRGQFIRGDGLVLPNNISNAGAQMILASAFKNTVPTFYMALVRGIPSADMTFADMFEPTIGVNGYARVEIERSAVGWPVEGLSGGERYIESKFCTFAASVGDFDDSIQRLALCSTNSYVGSDAVYALSVPLPAELTITPTTPLASRQFKYQIYI